MVRSLTLPNSRTTTALGFGCSSLLRLPDRNDRQRLLDCAVDHGVCHFDVARLYGLGLAEAELAPLLRRHSGSLTVATKFGLGDAAPPSGAAQSQGSLRQLLRVLPGLRPLARKLYARRISYRNFGALHCRQSLMTSLGQLGVEAVDLFLLHEPTPSDLIDPDLEGTLQDLQRQGLIGSYGLSGRWADCQDVTLVRPDLAAGWFQWDDDLLAPFIEHDRVGSPLPAGLGRFGRIRNALRSIQQALAAVPQLRHYWSERLNLNLADGVALGAAMLGAALASYPEDLLLYSSTDFERLDRTLTLLNDPPWSQPEAIAFESFWRSSASKVRRP